MLGEYQAHGAVLRRYSRSVSKLDAAGAEVIAAFRRTALFGAVGLDGADLRDAGRGVRRVYRDARRAGVL